MRIDEHKPTSIIPIDYEFVGFERIQGVTEGDLSACQYILSERQRIRNHMEKTKGTYSKHSHGGVCMVCGNASAIYTVLFYHAKSNSYVRMGQTCAEKCEIGYDKNGFSIFQTKLKEDLELQAGKRKAKAFLETQNLNRTWDIYENHSNYEDCFQKITIIDIVTKLIRYGSISESQIKFLHNLLKQYDDRKITQAKYTAEKEAAKPIPITDQRITISGIVVKKDIKENQFGIRQIMIVKSDDGWCIYGSCPDGIEIEKGSKIKFEARIEISKNDPKFGFFKRPTKISLIS